MEYTCFHCDHTVSNVRQVTFYEGDHEHDELLCEDCYSEWLESIKD